MPTSTCPHGVVVYTQTAVAMHTTLSAVHKFTCEACKVTARIVDKIDTDGEPE